MCIRCLELGYDGIVPAPSGRRVPWEDLPAVIEDLPIRIPAVRADGLFATPDGSLASSRDDEVLAARARIERGAAVARQVGAPYLIVEAPRVALTGEPMAGTDLRDGGDGWDEERLSVLCDRLTACRGRYLDRACRALHGVASAIAPVRLALTESPDLCSASQARDLQEVMDDLRGLAVAYWHRPAVVALRASLGGEGSGETLEMLSKYLGGTDLSDYSGRGLQAVPGSGGVDYAEVAPYMRSLHSGLPTVVDYDPACRDGDLRQGRAFLETFGL